MFLSVGAVGSAGASWAWYRLIRDGELILLSGLTLLTPAFAPVLALLIYRERVSALSIVGIAVVLVGVTWVGWPWHSTPARGGPGVVT